MVEEAVGSIISNIPGMTFTFGVNFSIMIGNYLAAAGREGRRIQ